MTPNRPVRAAGLVLCAGALAPLTAGQSLFQKPVQAPGPATLPGPGGQVVPLASPGAVTGDQPAPKVNPVAELEGVSLYAIQPSSARQFRPHDLITIIVNQSSKMEHNQKDDFKKTYTNQADLAAFPDLAKFLEFRLESGRLGGQDGGLPSLDLTAKNNFKGDSKLGREDRITARITAEVIEVKPNGNLLIEARSTQITDREEQTMILSGLCRGEDVSLQNTVQSTQLSNLHLETQHKGDVKDTATKGLIPRILETLFNF